MLKIVFIDDEAITLKLLTYAIDWEQLGIEIAGTAEDGPSGLDLCSRLKPDIVIADIKMPGFTGAELAERLRKTNQAVKIIFLSAYAEFEYAQSAITNKVSGYLLKPLDEGKLEELIGKIINEINAEQSLRQQSDSYLNTRAAADLRKAYLRYRNERKAAGGGRNDGFSSFSGQMLMGASGKSAKQAICMLHICPSGTLVLTNSEEDVRLILQNVMAGEFMFVSVSPYLRFVLSNHPVDANEVLRVLRQKGFAMHLGIVEVNGDVLDAMYLAESAAAGTFWTREEIGYGVRKPVSAPELSFKTTSYYIRQLVELGEGSSLAEFAGSYLDECEHSRVDPDDLALKVQDLFIWIKNAVMQQYAETELPKSILRHADFERIRACLSMPALRQYVNDRIGSVAEAVRTHLDETDSTTTVRRAKGYVEKKYGSVTFSLQETADYIGMSKNHFSRVFHDEAGMKFWDYVTEVRIRKAKRLLMNPDLSIAEISHMVGYETESHFNRKFKEIEGVTPGRYRKQYG